MNGQFPCSEASRIRARGTTLIGLVAAGCGSSDDSTTGGNQRRRWRRRGDFTIALLLPENETPRYETNDRPDFESSVKENVLGMRSHLLQRRR